MPPTIGSSRQLLVGWTFLKCLGFGSSVIRGEKEPPAHSKRVTCVLGSCSGSDTAGMWPEALTLARDACRGRSAGRAAVAALRCCCGQQKWRVRRHCGIARQYATRLNWLSDAWPLLDGEMDGGLKAGVLWVCPPCSRTGVTPLKWFFPTRRS